MPSQDPVAPRFKNICLAYSIVPAQSNLIPQTVGGPTGEIKLSNMTVLLVILRLYKGRDPKSVRVCI